MERRKFDDLTRTVAKGTPRRRVLKGIAGGLTAGLLGLTAVKPTLAVPEYLKTRDKLAEKCHKEFGEDQVAVSVLVGGPEVDPTCTCQEGQRVCDYIFFCQYEPHDDGGGPYGEEPIEFWQETKRVDIGVNC
jgi:hypothetical protein